MARPIHFPSGKNVDVQGLFPLKVSTLRAIKAENGDLLDIVRSGSANIEQKCQFIISLLNTAGANVTLADLEGLTEKWLDKFILEAFKDNTPDPVI